MTFPAFVFGVVYPLLCGAITFSLALHVARQQHDILAGFMFAAGLVFHNHRT